MNILGWLVARWQYVVVTLAMVGVALLIWWLLAWSAAEQAKWVAWCQSQGGHVISDTDTHVGVGYAPNTNGKGGGSVVTTVSSSTDYYCLNESGGIVGIR